MKKILLIASAAFLCVTGFAQTKFAHVNTEELVQLSPESDQARATLTASRKEAHDTYQAMVEELQTKYQKYEQNAQTWTAAIRQSKEKELTDIQTRIHEFEQSIQTELQQQQQQLMAPIYQKAIDTVKEIAKAGGYIYVFEVNGLVYFDESQSTDITPEARKRLNIPEGRTLEALQAEIQAQQQQLQ
ncbi:MAG: OmpH family outer membrane protein [Bacteroidales bacterium]|nr:OmpH family outer membrane protein [Bacteroidales bacterium]